jgi:hypothetical protein
MMFEATVSEFPFVGELPRADRRAAKSLWDRFMDFAEHAEDKGALVPPALAAKLLGVSRQRIWQLLDAGKLERLDFEGHAFITERSIVAWAKMERKTGRPFKPMERFTFKDALALAKECRK